MKFQIRVNLLGKSPDQPFKFSTKNRAEIKEDLCGKYNNNSQIKFKTSMVKSSLCDYSDTYILLRGTITVIGEGSDDAAELLDQRNMMKDE